MLIKSWIERGFSVNKALINDNMQEKTVVSRRSVKDFMQTHNLKPFDVKIAKELKKSVEFAREHYRNWLEQKNRWLSFKKARGRRSRN